MKRILVVLGLVGALGMVFGTVPAGAGGPGNSVTVTLSCDRGVIATVEATFVVNPTGGFSGQCGVNSKSVRQVIDVPDPETAILVTKFEVVSTETVDCASTPQQLSVPGTLDCGPKFGAKLTVR